MRTTQRGFTLVEVMVAAVVFAIFMVGMLNLLDTSTKVAQLETELADTQENVRFAAYHIMRTARMMGGAELPFAGTNATGDAWIAGGLISNASGSVAIPGFSNVQRDRGFGRPDPARILRDLALLHRPDHGPERLRWGHRPRGQQKR